MGGKNLTIILLACVIAAASLGVNAFLAPRIDDQRAKLQLTFNKDVEANLPPDVALMVTMFGSFRGLVIDFLWQKTNKLKEDNKIFAAYDLAELITKLQPRFKEVWVYHSWNMAYNISVMTKTQDERWMWVNNGIALLRDQGVVYNPDSVSIHKQLAWTFLHKVGRVSDDMHWYYKTKLAEEWQALLGPPPAPTKANRYDHNGEPILDDEGNPVRRWAAIEVFASIARMDQLFFAQDELPRTVQRGLRQLIQQRETELARLALDPDTDKVMLDLLPLVHARPQVFVVEATGRVAQWPAEDAAYAAELREMIDDCRTHLASLSDDRRPVDERFLEAFPEAEPQVRALREHGFDLDHETLIRIAERVKWLGVEQLGYQVTAKREQGVDTEFLNAWLLPEDRDQLRIRNNLILPYIRAKVLRTVYHMSPSYMYELMEGEWLIREDTPLTVRDESKPEPLPLDWRHPASHGLYWASRGVWVAKSQLHRSDTYHQEVLNTYRLQNHALQALTHNGRISYDPLSNYYEQMPDPNFIEGYLRLFYSSGEAIGGVYAESDAPDSFKSGHRNYLEWAVRLLFDRGYVRDIEGELDAQELYDELGRTYGKADEDWALAYSQPLEQFATAEIAEEEGIDSPDKARRAIYGRLWLAFKFAYANGMPEQARKHASAARAVYNQYQQEFAKDTANTYRSRMGLEAWEQMVTNALEAFMTTTSPVITMQMRQRVWAAIGNDENNAWRRNAIWDRIKGPLYQLAEHNPNPAVPSMPAEIRFPEPPGMEAWRKQKEAQGGTDDRTKTGEAADQYDRDKRPSNQGE